MESIVRQMMAALRKAWIGVADLRPRVVSIDTDPQVASTAPPPAMCVLVTMETRVDQSEGMVNLCLPLSALESVRGKMAAPSGSRALPGAVPAAETNRRELEGLWLKRYRSFPVPAMAPSDIAGLAPGSVIPVDPEATGRTLYPTRPRAAGFGIESRGEYE